MQKNTPKTKKQANGRCFYAVSCVRLYIFAVFSFGLYELYWAYRNWQGIKNAKLSPQDATICPLWRGWIFNLFWFLPLCRRIVKKYQASFIYMLAAFFYMICFYATFFYLGRIVEFALLRILTPLLLLPFQKLINTDSLQQKRNRWDFIVLLSGLLLTLCVPAFVRLWDIHSLLNMEEEKQQSLFVLSGVIYRYTTVYAEVCQQQSVSLDNYQQVFYKTFAEETGVVKHLLQKANLSLESFMMIMLDNDNNQEAVKTVASELEKLRKLLILQMIAANRDKPNLSKDWSDEYDNYLSIKETCELINTHPEAVIKLMGIDKFIRFYADKL